MGCSLYIGLFLFICWAWGSLWMCLCLQMVSVVLHLIKHWKHGPVQLNISHLPGNTIYIKFTNQRLSQKYHLPYPGLCAVLLAASLQAKKTFLLSSVRNKAHEAQDELLCISGKYRGGSDVWFVLLVRGFDINSVIDPYCVTHLARVLEAKIKTSVETLWQSHMASNSHSFFSLFNETP